MAEATDDTSAGEGIHDSIVQVLKTIFDPEIPVDIYELGLIYNIDINESSHVKVTMTLTSPMCPVAETLPPEVETKVSGVTGVNSAEIDLVWEPPWDPSMMTEAARLELGM